MASPDVSNCGGRQSVDTKLSVFLGAFGGSPFISIYGCAEAEGVTVITGRHAEL